jgi:hypothetical protein
MTMLREMLANAEHSPVDPAGVALIYAGANEFEQAIEWVERASEARSGMLPVFLKVDPRFDGLRRQPRFQKVLERMRLS